MRPRKQRRFRYRSNGRMHQHRSSGDKPNLGGSIFSNGKGRNNFKPQQSAEKLFERYTSLAKEALSSGDKILSENYLQHADHFSRIIETKNLDNNQNRIKVVEEIQKPQNNQSSNIKPDQDKAEDKIIK